MENARTLHVHRVKAFASLRFGGHGAKKEARELQAALLEEGIDLQIIDPIAGEDITMRVFQTMETCAALVVFGTRYTCALSDLV